MFKTLIAVLAAFSMALCSQGAVHEAQSCTVGEPMPHFVVTSTKGAKLRAATLHGHPLILSFWATWCTPCLQDMSVLDHASQRYRKQGIKVLGMIVNTPRKEIVRHDLALENARYPQYFVPEDMEETFDVQRGLPLTIFVDQRGIVRQIYRGALTATLLEQQIHTLFLK